MMKRSTTSKREVNTTGFNQREIDWELRPGGMLVQRRNDGDESSWPMIKIKVSYGSCHYDVSVPAQSTFGDLKRVLAQDTGLEPKEQRLLFRGKEKEDGEYLHMVGVKDMPKVVLFEDPASKERKLEEIHRNQIQGLLQPYEAVDKVRAEVDKLSDKVVALERAVRNGTKVEDKEFAVLTELLMVELLKLDAIEVDGEAKVQRRVELQSSCTGCRVQSFVDTLDNLKARNSNPLSSSGNAVLMTTKREMCGSGVGSLTAPVPVHSSAKVTQDWELFD